MASLWLLGSFSALCESLLLLATAVYQHEEWEENQGEILAYSHEST